MSEIKIRLSDPECHFAAMLGMARELQARSRNIPEQKRTAKGGWHIHIAGAGAELAVMKHYGIYPNLVRWNADNIVRRPDIEIMGKKVDIKSTEYIGSQFMRVYRPAKEKPTQVYMMTEVAFPWVTIVGWAPKEDVQLDRWFNDKGNYWEYPRYKIRALREKLQEAPGSQEDDPQVAREALNQLKLI